MSPSRYLPAALETKAELGRNLIVEAEGEGLEPPSGCPRQFSRLVQ